MNISQKMVDGMNKQINLELYSAYLYKAIALHFSAKDIRGFAHWYEIQKLEEEDHAQLFINYLQDHGQDVVLEAIDKPTQTFESDLAALEAADEHEKFITKSINELYELAVEEKDYLAQQLLAWFVKEQFEEEQNSEEMVHLYKYIQDDKNALFGMEKRLAGRQREPITDVL